MAKFKCAKEIVLLKPTKIETDGGLIAVEKDQPKLGEVVAIGDGDMPVNFKIGSIVAYREFGEFKFYVEGEMILFVKFEDILAVYE